MRLINGIFGFLLALKLCGTSALATEHSIAPPIRLVTGNDFAPYTDEALPNGGIVTQIVTAALEHSGQSSNVEFLPWARGLNQTVKLVYDATFPYLHSPGRAKRTLSSAPVITPAGALVTHAQDDRRYQSLSDLVNKHVCVPVGYENNGALGSMAQNGQIHVYAPQSPAQCYLMMGQRRVDFLWAFKATSTFLIQSNGLQLSDFRFTPFSGIQLPNELRFLVSRDHPQAERLINKLDASIAAYKITKDYQALSKFYHLDSP